MTADSFAGILLRSAAISKLSPDPYRTQLLTWYSLGQSGEGLLGQSGEASWDSQVRRPGPEREVGVMHLV